MARLTGLGRCRVGELSRATIASVRPAAAIGAAAVPGPDASSPRAVAHARTTAIPSQAGPWSTGGPHATSRSDHSEMVLGHAVPRATSSSLNCGLSGPLTAAGRVARPTCA